MGTMVGASIPAACQDWANTKEAYRFFCNECVETTGRNENEPQKLKNLDASSERR